MVNLNITVIQGDEDGVDSMISLDVLKREDASDKEYKIVKALETYMFDMIKALPTVKLKETRELLTEKYNDLEVDQSPIQGERE